MRTKERLPRKRYSPEFKMELVRLALEQDVTNGANSGSSAAWVEENG
ncbi:hypothetical protein QQC79_004012 [Escherichia coli]|nr:hypothetical protein [Escherichia coli]